MKVYVMKPSEIEEHLKCLMPAIEPSRIEMFEKYWKEHGDIGYLWQSRTQAVVSFLRRVSLRPIGEACAG